MSENYTQAARQQLALYDHMATRAAVEGIFSQLVTSEPGWNDNGPNLLSPYQKKDFTGKALATAGSVRAILSEAQPYFWSAEMCALLHQAAEVLPEDTALKTSDLPTKAGYVWFDEPIPIPIHPDTPKYTSDPKADWLRGFIWYRFSRHTDSFAPLHSAPEGLWMGFLVEDNDLRFGGVLQGLIQSSLNDTCVAIMTIAEDSGFTKHLNVTNAKLRHAFAALKLMNQPILVHPAESVDRSERRRWERAKLGAPEVEVIRLRRRRYIAPTSGDGERKSVDWSCQWLVGAHWRTYRKGAKDEYERYVSTYRKGPEDKPLKVAGQKIFAVVQ